MPVTRMLMINIGHGLNHLLMLLFPVVAALAASAFDEDYGPLLALSTGSWLVGSPTGGAGAVCWRCFSLAPALLVF